MVEKQPDFNYGCFISRFYRVLSPASLRFPGPGVAQSLSGWRVYGQWRPIYEGFISWLHDLAIREVGRRPVNMRLPAISANSSPSFARMIRCGKSGICLLMLRDKTLQIQSIGLFSSSDEWPGTFYRRIYLLVGPAEPIGVRIIVRFISQLLNRAVTGARLTISWP